MAQRLPQRSNWSRKVDTISSFGQESSKALAPRPSSLAPGQHSALQRRRCDIPQPCQRPGYPFLSPWLPEGRRDVSREFPSEEVLSWGPSTYRQWDRGSSRSHSCPASQTFPPRALQPLFTHREDRFTPLVRYPSSLDFKRITGVVINYYESSSSECCHST